MLLMHEKQWKVIYILGPQFLPYTPEKFEIAALFLRLDLPCTLIRDENGALFLRLGLPSTLIRQEDGGFRKHFSSRKNAGKRWL